MIVPWIETPAGPVSNTAEATTFEMPLACRQWLFNEGRLLDRKLSPITNGGATVEKLLRDRTSSVK